MINNNVFTTKKGGKQIMDNNKNQKKVYIRPEDTLELLLKKAKKCNDKEEIEECIAKMLCYFKDEKFDRLSEEFDLEV